MLRFHVPAILFLCLTAPSTPAYAQSGATASISIDRKTTTPLNPGFSGYNTALLRDAVEYYDQNFQQFSGLMYAGWLRFPAGTASGAYNWQNGLMILDWVNEFKQPWLNALQPIVPLVAGK